MCDEWNYNAANSYTPNDLRHGPITVWPQGRVTPAMRASCGDCARFWSKQVRLVADVPMEFRSFDDDAAAKVTEWRPRPTPFLPQAAVADAVADRLARALALTPPAPGPRPIKTLWRPIANRQQVLSRPWLWT